ncbi:MAG TPA: 4-(cytidine 5'-diphospho)-2-C-methyl-D-erythritol kinase [Acidimicrobiia bacterium]|nr:4-(cytidine 5'-diphospho)-2-C-methyl-D-erythritol kinase [Acidimicrobiia bacterium]
MNELTQRGRLRRVRATAHAKLTLSLAVHDRRPDGYHNLEALAVSIGDPHDQVEVEAVPHPGGVSLEVDGAVEHVPTGPNNLAARAAEDLLIHAGRSGHGVRMRLLKGIPAGTGLGGGSADAAAALAAVRRMLEVDVDDAELVALAARIGSDVPFCLRGGAAWMRGRGEELEPVTLTGVLPVVVALPPLHVATPDVYAAWDELGGPVAARRVPAPAAVSDLVDDLGNDLEVAAETVEPRLAAFRADLEEAAGRPAILAGSGSAYAVLPVAGTAADATSLARRVGRRMRVPVAGTVAVAHGVRLSA